MLNHGHISEIHDAKSRPEFDVPEDSSCCEIRLERGDVFGHLSLVVDIRVIVGVHVVKTDQQIKV